MIRSQSVDSNVISASMMEVLSKGYCRNTKHEHKNTYQRYILL